MATRTRTGKRADQTTPLPSFGRPVRSDAESLTDLGCPDCRGVLAVKQLDHGHLWFTCRIGHAFSVESLLRQKEEQLETSLWTAVQSYSEVASFYRELAHRSDGIVDKSLAAGFLKRARLAEMNEESVRKMIAGDGPTLAAQRSTPPARKRARGPT